MKKRAVFLLTAAVLTLSACGGQTAPDAQPAQAPAPPLNVSDAAPTTQSLSAADARRIALEHAGVSESDATFVKTDRETDGGRVEYEVEFFVGSVKYDYAIDAETGAVLSFEADGAELSADAAPPSASDPAQGGLIGRDEAKAIALAHAGLSESGVSGLQVKLDRDGGRAEYEVEFYAGGSEYGYDIDAASGEILSFEIDND
ncbi:MAG: PepSY domain-containing protein [Oscillibacter sp.]|nr:PepSY domain-containing protein [Oscillibacter sp.]